LTDSIDARLAAAGLPALPRRAWAEIDELALAGNLRAVRELAGPSVVTSAVVKANAYGHGLVPVGRVFAAAGADRLCVASLDEALTLRAASLDLPVLVLFAIPPAAVSVAARERIEIVAAEPETLRTTLDAWRRAASAEAGSESRDLAVHLEIETGLERAGLSPAAAVDAARLISETPGARLAGLWTHLARSENADATTEQVALFERAAAGLRGAAIRVPPRHMDATGGLFTGHAPRYEGVRVGLALYGMLPEGLPFDEAGAAAARALGPAMSLKCRPLRVERVAAGTPVGYGALWHAPRDSVVATLPFGYGDGWARSSVPGAQALVRGRRVPLVGSVAMDVVMADVTDVAGVTLADEFVLLGRQGTEEISAHELARTRNTIPYEVITNVAHRVPRVYHAGPVLKGLRTLDGEAWVAPGRAAGWREPRA
jgi:alanine racemase